jgi:hypothetical protein
MRLPKFLQRKDKIERLQEKIRRTLAKRGLAFDALKSPEADLAPIKGIERLRALVPYYDCPMTTLEQWTALVVTDEGSYIAPVRTALRYVSTIYLRFGPLTAKRKLKVNATYVRNENGVCVGTSDWFYPVFVGDADTFFVNYKIFPEGPR